MLPIHSMFTKILKANPFRDALGKFASKNTAVSPSGWDRVGQQKGSNPGGTYQHNGAKYYVKFPRDRNQVYSEAETSLITARSTSSALGPLAI